MLKTALIPKGGALQGPQIPKGFALGIFCFKTYKSELLIDEMGLTELIPNGGALQGPQIPKGFALVFFYFLSFHKQACDVSKGINCVDP
ncbi:MAG: hypothetical protein IPK10_12310 [Bacteroidetes bacterium]|nr:hypothetical protein [Bacteroidota bacterium]